MKKFLGYVVLITFVSVGCSEKNNALEVYKTDDGAINGYDPVSYHQEKPVKAEKTIHTNGMMQPGTLPVKKIFHYSKQILSDMHRSSADIVLMGWQKDIKLLHNPMPGQLSMINHISTTTGRCFRHGGEIGMNS